MAAFEPAFEALMKWEDSKPSGKVTFDSGGKTRFGVSANANQMPENFWTDPPYEAINLAKALYLQKYWKFSRVTNQNVANKLFDMVVNMGANGIKLAQKCVHVECDGEYGPITEAAINCEDGTYLLSDLRAESCEFYRRLAEGNPDKYMAYLKGWLRRGAA